MGKSEMRGGFATDAEEKMGREEMLEIFRSIKDKMVKGVKAAGELFNPKTAAKTYKDQVEGHYTRKAEEEIAQKAEEEKNTPPIPRVVDKVGPSRFKKAEEIPPIEGGGAARPAEEDPGAYFTEEEIKALSHGYGKRIKAKEREARKVRLQEALDNMK